MKYSEKIKEVCKSDESLGVLLGYTILRIGEILDELDQRLKRIEEKENNK